MKRWTMLLIVVVVGCRSGSSLDAQSTGSNFQPEVVRYGALLPESTNELKPLCTKLEARQMQRPFLVLREIVKVRQMQLDCAGFRFAGAERWAEFVFADDSLVLVWILTEASDEAELLRRMIAAYGDPTHRNEKFIAFANHGAALRTDRPEVLFFAPSLKSNIVPWFGSPSTFR